MMRPGHTDRPNKTYAGGLKMSLPPVDVCIRSLAINGYVMDRAHSDHGLILLDFHKYDRFGVRMDYSFALYDSLGEPGLKALRKLARGRSLVLIGPSRFKDAPSLSWDELLGKLGGPVNTWAVTDPQFPVILNDLGHNQLPPGFEGNADTLFEDLVRDALMFLLTNRVIQYGQERLFEKLPDGLAFIDHSTPVLYDCKAYGKGFSITADDIRRFSSYVQDFNQRYGSYLKPVQSFLVITGELTDSVNSISGRARELRAESNVQLVALSAKELGAIVQLLTANPLGRRAINWKLLLSDSILIAKDVAKELKRVDKDAIIGGLT